MGIKTIKVKTCDWPGCDAEGEGVEDWTLSQGQRRLRAQLCSEHGKPLSELMDVMPAAAPTRRRRERVVVDPDTRKPVK